MLEIERKFLVTERTFDELELLLEPLYRIQQGYIVNRDDVVIRVRIDERFGRKVRPPIGIVCVKKPIDGSHLVRSEDEYEIDVETARNLIQHLPQLSKIRYRMDDYTFDVFQDDLKGLIVAEREYDSVEEAVKDVTPSWAEKDVTDEITYLNSILIGKKFINGAVA